jgi:NAD(P)H-quinone oxidoreductase subunit 5
MLSQYIYLDALSVTMIILICFITGVVGAFAVRYLQGDRKQYQFYFLLSALLVCIVLLVSVDNLLLFLLCWGLSNYLLVRLMLHKNLWLAAKNSAQLASKNFMLSFIGIAAAFGFLYLATNELSIQAILQSNLKDSLLLPASILLLFAAMAQSALWPFHTWLLSSLNSPTPVSAVMHAGLVNGGGFLLARFAPLYKDHPSLLAFIVIVGLVTAILGNLWKLIQNDVKRMLACSTMGQMGFMLLQCGLGLFSAAIAHLCLHGLFKSYLFLASGSAAKDKNIDRVYTPRMTNVILAPILGIISAYSFAFFSNKIPLENNTNLILVLVSYIGGTQLALNILSSELRSRFVLALIASVAMCSIYGAVVNVFQSNLSYLNMPQKINAIHILSMLVLFMFWLISIFYTNLQQLMPLKKYIAKAYVSMLNASQPDPKTITAHRYLYNY